MARYSDRKIILNRFKKAMTVKLIPRLLRGDNDWESIFEGIPQMKMHLLVSQFRYLNGRVQIPRAPSKMDWLFNYFDDERFKQELRMNKAFFFAILDLIKNNPVFASNPKRPQTDVKYQMAVALYFLGTDGVGGSVGRIARDNGISEGSDVVNFRKRFIIAILGLESEVIFWPDVNERKEISSRIEEETGFPSCIEFVDGSLIPLEDKPFWKGEDFYTRKSNYAMSAMIVCDDQKLIRLCYTGWVGSAHDSRVFSKLLKVCIFHSL